MIDFETSRSFGWCLGVFDSILLESYGEMGLDPAIISLTLTIPSLDSVTGLRIRLLSERSGTLMFRRLLAYRLSLPMARKLISLDSFN